MAEAPTTSDRKFFAYAVAAFSGPLLIVLFSFLEGRPPKRTSEWNAALLFALLASAFSVASVFAVNWMRANPTARMHSSEVFRRASLLALSAGPIWGAVQFSKWRFFRSAENILFFAALVVAISLTAWLLTHVIGWVLAGARSEK